MQGPVWSDGRMSGCGRSVGCGCSVGEGRIPCIVVLWLVLSHLLVGGPRLGGRH